MCGKKKTRYNLRQKFLAQNTYRTGYDDFAKTDNESFFCQMIFIRFRSFYFQSLTVNNYEIFILIISYE